MDLSLSLYIYIYTWPVAGIRMTADKVLKHPWIVLSKTRVSRSKMMRARLPLLYIYIYIYTYISYWYTL